MDLVKSKMDISKGIICHLIKLEVDRSNIVSSNGSKTKKSMFPCTSKNNTLIVVEKTSNHTSDSWMHRKQISWKKENNDENDNYRRFPFKEKDLPS